MLEWLAQYWLDILFGFLIFLVTGGYKKLSERQKEGAARQEAIEIGIQALLRDRIIQVYNHCVDKGFCPIYARDDVKALFEQYKALGGNGTTKELLEKLSFLQVCLNYSEISSIKTNY